MSKTRPAGAAVENQRLALETRDQSVIGGARSLDDQPGTRWCKR